ncbi:hypothetical protein P7K49_032511 [Saguinus oedipus]|uniref:Uncharacterized protein n=1 Tax=Saguinus oedipus TaxID=9490 RepID=A0ABQ9TZE0_SAGOE|nr:hypothetical protein P7K49_032511 [Saguinus oedipus]
MTAALQAKALRGQEHCRSPSEEQGSKGAGQAQAVRSGHEGREPAPFGQSVLRLRARLRGACPAVALVVTTRHSERPHFCSELSPEGCSNPRSSDPDPRCSHSAPFLGLVYTPGCREGPGVEPQGGRELSQL